MVNLPHADERPGAAGDEARIAELQALLDALPPPLEPLDPVALDGFLCGVLVQPKPPPAARWMRHVVDVEARAAPPGGVPTALQRAVMARHEELRAAITARRWFDPWVFELEGDPTPSETVLPWVAGFAMAMSLFPEATASDDPALIEPLALLYRHLDPGDLEDADALLEVIETLDPPADLAEAVEDLVRAVLLIADVTQPPQRPAARRTAR